MQALLFHIFTLAQHIKKNKGTLGHLLIFIPPKLFSSTSSYLSLLQPFCHLEASALSSCPLRWKSISFVKQRGGPPQHPGYNGDRWQQQSWTMEDKGNYPACQGTSIDHSSEKKKKIIKHSLHFLPCRRIRCRPEWFIKDGSAGPWSY